MMSYSQGECQPRPTIATWADPDDASVLRSAEEVEAAIADGRLAVERPGVVLNMPFLSWPGGER